VCLGDADFFSAIARRLFYLLEVELFGQAAPFADGIIGGKDQLVTHLCARAQSRFYCLMATQWLHVII